MCNGCLTLYEQDKNCGLHEKLNSMLAKFEVLNNTITELRTEVANNTKVISDLSAKKNSVVNPCTIGSSSASGSRSNEHSNANNAWGQGPPILQSDKSMQQLQESRDNNKRSEIPPQRQKKAKSSLLIKCDEEGETPSLADIREIAISNGIPVTQVRVTTNKNTVVSVPNEDVLNKLKPLLSANMSLNKFEVANVREKLPRISVIDLEEEYDEQNFVNTLKLQNPDVATVIGNDETISDFYSKKSGTRFQVNITVSDNVRKVIKNRGNRLFIGLKSCRVVDKVNISRCFKCHDHRHFAQECTNVECCGYCSSIEHVSEDCPLKLDVVRNKSQLKCVNCARHNLAGVGHSVYWPLCPINKRYNRTGQGQSERLN